MLLSHHFLILIVSTSATVLPLCCLQTCSESLHHTLQIVSALHDITSYLLSFSRLGNRDDSCSWRTEPGVTHLAADWGGSEGIGSELQEIQRQVDRLSDCSLRSVGRLLQLRRQVVLLQFDAAVRNLIREAFLSSGDVASYHSVSDNMATALPLLSDSIQTDVFGLTLPVPQPLEAQSSQAQTMYPWRSFMACHGLMPLHVWDVPPVEYCMQVQHLTCCLTCLVYLWKCLLVTLVQNKVYLQAMLLRELLRIIHKAEEEKTDSFPPLQDPIRIQSVLKGFLLLMKQLEVFKESWARRRLGTDVFRSPAAYQTFVKLYRAEVFDPSMRALAQQRGKKLDYEASISASRSLLPPPGASEVDVKTWQLHLLLEASECDMIRAVQKKIHRETTLVLSEKTRQDARLPTGTKKQEVNLSPERPQMVETFVQQLMNGAEQEDGELKLSEDHLHQCLTHLGSSVMDRERRCFLLYSQFYEQILQQQTELLYQREQVQQPAIQTPLQTLFCHHLQAGLDEYHQQIEQEVSAMVNRTRAEGVDRIVKLKKNYGCTKDHNELVLTQAENSRLEALICKLKALSCWRQTVDQEKLHRQLLQTQQVRFVFLLNISRVILNIKQCAGIFVLLLHIYSPRKELDRYRAESLERMRADVDDRDRQLTALGEQLDRGSRMNRLERQRSAKEIQQVCTLSSVDCVCYAPITKDHK
uniref:Coiled-coil domain containing 162 n=1 Tax=Stegastes partitus TaxID=144197 RepID=A0A3B5B6N4_9TELE